ncbi:uncharacterized protein LOC112167035 [Rosa chinensis]|uniref:uncharacterized protein LOC112167035 n=1 Tax=Rosa chinensis TaxID=74649 RepID=UPI000D092308|nr:uncharacterized protein LOC112167035 [Rosa chinensis]
MRRKHVEEDGISPKKLRLSLAVGRTNLDAMTMGLCNVKLVKKVCKKRSGPKGSKNKAKELKVVQASPPKKDKSPRKDLILNSLEPKLQDSVLCCTTPHAVWEDLRERFELGNAPRIFQVQRDIYRIEQGQSSIAEYYTKLKGLWDELASYNTVTCTRGAQNDLSKLMQFLMGLNESYAATRGHILLMNPLPSVRQAYASLVQEEKQRELGSPLIAPFNTAAMAIRSYFRSQPHMQGNQGNTQASNFCPYAPIKHCTYCGKDYHTEATCHKKHGYPPGHHLYKGPKEANSTRQRQGSPSSNHVNANPTFKELQGMLPNLTEDHYTQVIAALTPTPQIPQANATTSATEYATGLGYEDDDWCG